MCAASSNRNSPLSGLVVRRLPVHWYRSFLDPFSLLRSIPSRDLSWRPLSMGIALHRGPVFFGNIGSRDRLDFTAIGRTVNLAARIEPLSKTTGRRLLLSDRVAELIEEPVEELGDFPIRGIPDPVILFTVPEHGL